jgi:mannose/fructose/N-acetylgalactosamine-specific phosphotransferase system component IIC
MMPDPGTLLLLVLLGGVAALDGTSLGQVMVSRPLVAATLAGWALGSPAQGALLGLFLEAMHLAVLPVGASRYPEGGPPAVAGAAFFVGSHGTYGELLPIVLFCLVWEWASGVTVQWLRHSNARFAIAPGVAEVDPGSLQRRHAGALATDFLRGALVTVVGIYLLGAFLWLLPEPETPERLARLALGAAAAASIAASVRLFGTRRLPLFVLGAACGAAVLALR